MVDKDNYIIDGQHRYLAAKELGLPIYFIKDKSIEKKDLWKEIVDVNRAGKLHGYLDIFDMLVKKKNVFAIEINEVTKKYEHDRGQAIFFLVSPNKRIKLIDALRDENFTLKKDHEQRVVFIEKFNDEFGFIRNIKLAMLWKK